MEIDSIAAGGALKPDGDRFRRDEEPRFLIGEELSGLIPGAVRFTFPSLALSLHPPEITFFCLDDRGEEEDVGKLRQGAKLVLELGPCKDCERYQYKSFELNIVVSQACLAGVSLLCVSHNLRKHGIRKFLFVDQLSGRMGRLKFLYIQQTRTLLDCLYFCHSPFLVVTDSQFTTLFQTTAYSGRITYINGGDFAVSAVVQVVGIILCLHAATKISHRAQAIASVASKWHAIMLCSSTDTTQIKTSPSGVHLEATTNPPISFQN
ncbi:hypothetical protein HID58_067874 [Brassica napus]|uniref:Uncharacterized protein n=1 Tax=Brassica napus TaxID=3708 RepID=A0ABQ7ZKD0_BRANA|nr:hypothetical protein HID58_067874 [Brassica napus]